MEVKMNRKVPFRWSVRLLRRCIRDFSDSFLTEFYEVRRFLGALEHIHSPPIGVCCVRHVASGRRLKAQDTATCPPSRSGLATLPKPPAARQLGGEPHERREHRRPERPRHYRVGSRSLDDLP